MPLRPLLAVLLFGTLAACTPKPKVDQAAVFKVLEENMQAMQREDIDAVMATVHPASPDFASTREVIEQIFSKYDLKYELRDLKVVDATPDEVKVSFVQKTERTGGATDLPDNLVEGVHTLKKDGDLWKMIRTVTLRVTTLKPQ